VLMRLPDQGSQQFYRIGDRYTGELNTIQDLEDCIDWIEHGRLPRGIQHGYWIARKYIVHPERGWKVPVATVSSFHVFTARAFRAQGVELIRKIIDAITSGSLTLTASESDADYNISVEDLAYLTDAQNHGRTRAFYTLVGYVR
jgi:hypothetical protein